jgi:hypothetical protein
MWEMMMKCPTKQGPTQTESGDVPVRNMPTQVEVVAANTLPGVESIHANEAESQPEDAARDDASAPGSPRGPYLDMVVSGSGLTLPGDATLGDTISASMSADIVDRGATCHTPKF